MFSDPSISRDHMEFHRFKMSDSDDKVYWRILDQKSTTRCYVNRQIVPHNDFVPLNDNDMISIGGNHTIEQVRQAVEKGEKRKFFLYVIQAPRKWFAEEETKSESTTTASGQGNEIILHFVKKAYLKN